MAALAISIVCMLLIASLVRTGRMRAKYSLLWFFVGLAMIAMSIWPPLLHVAARAIGVAYPPALLFVGAIIFLLVLTIHFSWELSRLEERVRILAEETALNRHELDAHGDALDQEGES